MLQQSLLGGGVPAKYITAAKLFFGLPANSRKIIIYLFNFHYPLGRAKYIICILHGKTSPFGIPKVGESYRTCSIIFQPTPGCKFTSSKNWEWLYYVELFPSRINWKKMSPHFVLRLSTQMFSTCRIKALDSTTTEVASKRQPPPEPTPIQCLVESLEDLNNWIHIAVTSC